MSLSYQRVLSIQSHVTFGYVGGKAATFPLQLMGYDVDVVNTVIYTNHAGYHSHGGTKTSAAVLDEIFQAMKRNEMIIAGRLLTGYIPDAESLSKVANLASDLRRDNPQLIYLLDPVLGDAGRMYVSPNNIIVYRTMLPLATVITPNWYEAGLLADTQIKDFPSLQNVLKILHQTYRVPNVVISSIPLHQWLFEVLPEHLRHFSISEKSGAINQDTNFLICISSSATTHMASPSVVHAQTVRCLPGYYSGVGDLFSALLLGHYHTDSSVPLDDKETPLSYATSQALTKTHSVLCRTYQHAESLPEEERLPTDDEEDALDPLRRIRRMRGRELRLVQSQDILGYTQGRRLKPWVGFWNGMKNLV